MNFTQENFTLLLADLTKYLELNYKPAATGEMDSEIYKSGKLNINNEIKELLENMDASFSDRLLEIIRERNISEVDVYKRAGIDRRYFEKIRNKKRRKLERLTIILLCLTLELSFKEARDLYQRAGYAFSGCIKIDMIGKYFIEREIYDVDAFRKVLYEFGLLRDEK